LFFAEKWSSRHIHESNTHYLHKDVEKWSYLQTNIRNWFQPLLSGCDADMTDRIRTGCYEAGAARGRIILVDPVSDADSTLALAPVLTFHLERFQTNYTNQSSL
jgi:hypothetical protein